MKPRHQDKTWIAAILLGLGLLVLFGIAELINRFRP
jgi:hypothetical protein